MGTLVAAATLCRLEATADRLFAIDFHRCLLQAFINAHPKSLMALILDFDGTIDRIYDEQ